MTDYSRLRIAMDLLAAVATGEVVANLNVIAFRVDMSRITATQATRLIDLGFSQDETGWLEPDWYVSKFTHGNVSP